MTPRQRSRWAVFLLTLAALAAFTAGVTAISRATYTVHDEARRFTVSGSFQDVGEMLAAEGIALRPQDRVDPPVDTQLAPNAVINIQRARAVQLHTADGARTVWTLQPDLNSFLAEVEIDIRPSDRLVADGRPVRFEELRTYPLPSTVKLEQATRIVIHDGDQTVRLSTTTQTVGQALNEAGVSVFVADKVTPPLGSRLEPDLAITIERSIPVQVRVDGNLLHTRTSQRNSWAVLSELGIGLIGYDYTQPGPEVILNSGDTIHVIRVTESFEVQDVSIPFETVWQASDQLELDQKSLLSAGAPGILRKRIRIRYENGIEISRAPDGEWIAREPVNAVMGYGTRIIIRAIETPDGVFEYWRVVRMRVTSYTAASSGKPPEHPAYGITASGVQAGTGVVAVDRSVVPFRSWVYVPGYGVGFAGDTGGGVKGRWIDLGYNEDDFVYWSGYVDVYYLVPVPEPDKISFRLPERLP